jgi:hypothetical protein
MIGYNQALERIEEFMVKSGVRDYCVNVCKGKCCQGCYETENACHKNEGRRLKCSWFICSDLTRNIFKDKMTNYWELGALISEALARSNGNKIINAYFHPYPNDVMEKFSIDEKFFDEYLPDPLRVKENLDAWLKSYSIKHMATT